MNVTIEYTPTAGVFGFGVMFGSADKTAGITDLYAVGFGTVDHHVYGDWNWQGNYVPAAQLGIAAAESAAGDRARVTLFYPFETLCGEKYSLGIDENAVSVSLQMFEYVTDNSGNLYGIYNCINVNGAPLAFDTGAANFPVWEIRRKTHERSLEKHNEPGGLRRAGVHGVRFGKERAARTDRKLDGAGL